MSSIKGSETEKNLLIAFAGESQARNRYTFFSSIAKKEGLVRISHVFEETANHERAHAKRFFSFLEGGEVEITWPYPAGVLGSTLENLRHAAEGERYEHSEMYPNFAKIAQQEGFNQVAAVFKSIAHAEQYHEARYVGLADTLEKSAVFKREMEVKWRCRNCGYIHSSMEAPSLCPACAHPQAHYEVHCEVY